MRPTPDLINQAQPIGSFLQQVLKPLLSLATKVSLGFLLRERTHYSGLPPTRTFAPRSNSDKRIGTSRVITLVVQNSVVHLGEL